MNEPLFAQRKKAFLIILLCLIVLLIFKGLPVTSWGPGTNNRNYSVRTTVNVTNAYPEILNVTCNNGTSVTLNAGTTKIVSCIVKIRDYNTWDDVNYVNGTFYYNLNKSSDPDDNNTHYTNTSCSQTSNDGNYLVNWTCSFPVWYYASNGTWVINATANDTFGAQANNNGTSNISSLLALNVTETIDFGQLYVTQTSPTPIQANVTNFGNVPINVTVYGFGGENPTYTTYAMICDQRNITSANERYSLDGSAVYDAMTSITGISATLPGLKIEKQTVPDAFMVNSTYWRLHVNLTNNPFGICNGTVVFSAISP